MRGYGFTNFFLWFLQLSSQEIRIFSIAIPRKDLFSHACLFTLYCISCKESSQTHVKECLANLSCEQDFFKAFF